jgi:hypothetical protein
MAVLIRHLWQHKSVVFLIHCALKFIADIKAQFIGYLKFSSLQLGAMEQHTLKNVNNGLNTKIYSYLETSVGKIANLYLNVVHFYSTGVN